MQTNKDIPTLSAMLMFSSDSSFWQYKVYADIGRGSLEKRHQMTVDHVLTLVLLIGLA